MQGGQIWSPTSFHQSLKAIWFSRGNLTGAVEHLISPLEAIKMDPGSGNFYHDTFVGDNIAKGICRDIYIYLTKKLEDGGVWSAIILHVSRDAQDGNESNSHTHHPFWFVFLKLILLNKNMKSITNSPTGSPQ